MKKISRIRQQAGEMLSPPDDKTEYDPRLLALLMRADRAKFMTKRLVEHSKAAVGPRHCHEMNCLEELGRCMHNAGRTVHINKSIYGLILIKAGQSEERLGQVERELILSVYSRYIDPMEVYTKLDTKNINKEKSALGKKRLDLDVCKKAQRQKTSNEQRIASCHKVKLAQAEYDRQAEVLQMVLERVAKTHDDHLRHLKDLVKQQLTYFERCFRIVTDLHKELYQEAVTKF